MGVEIWHTCDVISVGYKTKRVKHDAHIGPIHFARQQNIMEALKEGLGNSWIFLWLEKQRDGILIDKTWDIYKILNKIKKLLWE